MQNAAHGDAVTQLLQQWQAGDPAAHEELFTALLPELRRMAHRALRGERCDHTLQPSALVNEAALRLLKIRTIDWRDRRHFLAVAATLMRRLLVDHARARSSVALQRLESVPAAALSVEASPEQILQLDFLLDALERESPQRRSLVELKFFVGLTDEEAADVLDLKLHTLQREWFRARQWLFQRMAPQT